MNVDCGGRTTANSIDFVPCARRMKSGRNPSVVVVISTVMVLVRGPPSVVPTAAASPVAGARRPFVAVLGLLAVAGEVSPVSALVAPAVGVEALPAASSGAGQGEGDPDLPALDVGAVGHLAGLLRVVFVLVHHEGEAGRRPRHPDLAERPELAEGLLEVAFGRLGVQVGDVQTVSLLVAVAHGAAVAPVAIVPVGAPGPRVFRTPRPPPRVIIAVAAS